MFQLDAEEWNNLKSQNATSSWGGTRKRPFAFTENGVAMLSSVLRSQTAIKVNINIMRAFTIMRNHLADKMQMFQRIAKIEKHQIETDKRIDEVFKRLNPNTHPQEGIFFNGQIFDAYRFHDRFLILDDSLYHFGASFKDLGRRLFAFEMMGIDKNTILNQL